MKKFIRALIKLPATPFVVVYFVVLYILTCIVQFFEWVYEASEQDKKWTKKERANVLDAAKKWFTTV
jgi:fatty acid desaturase